MRVYWVISLCAQASRQRQDFGPPGLTLRFTIHDNDKIWYLPHGSHFGSVFFWSFWLPVDMWLPRVVF